MGIAKIPNTISIYLILIGFYGKILYSEQVIANNITDTSNNIIDVNNFIGKEQPCFIPEVIRGRWFSWEKKNVETEINANSMTNRGTCLLSRENRKSNFTFLFQTNDCYHCVNLIVRTLNVLEKIELECVSRNNSYADPTVQSMCGGLRYNQQLITFFKESPDPVSCRSALEGVWQFAYQNRFRETGECNSPDSRIMSCQTPGSQFLIMNQKFNISFKECPGVSNSFNGVVEYSCLGDWFVGRNHFFAVANTKESRKDEKYRCFLRNREDDIFMGASITAECNTLETVEQSPMRFRMNPVKSDIVIPGCHLPTNMTGEWINTDNIDAEVKINETHIIERWYPDEGRYREIIYICMEKRGTRVMMARLTVDGCQKDYVCYDFLPRHHNVIRYRRGFPDIHDNFHTVCSWVHFSNRYTRKNTEKIKWRYNTFLAKNPVPIRCPVAGKFEFHQEGDILFETRLLGGLTEAPRPNTYCKKNISDFSVCDSEQKEIAIDENYCLSVDHLGRPVDIYSDPDYKMKCIGYWKENLKSYLITYDDRDPFSKYRCWVYQRADLNKILMSQAIGPTCKVNQQVTSKTAAEGAAVAISMIEYERERDQCPMFFDEGSNPWETSEDSRILNFRFGSGSDKTINILTLPTIITLLLINLFLLCN